MASMTLKLEVTIDVYLKDQVHVVTIQTKNPGGWSPHVVSAHTDDPSVGNAVRKAVMDLIEQSCLQQHVAAQDWSTAYRTNSGSEWTIPPAQEEV